MKLNGSEIFAEVLIEQGVDVLFGYPGGSVLNLYDALYKYSDRITHVMTAHEQGAAHAADGYARATGRTGVVLATSGPGATNLVTGIATAYMDSVPMVAFTGNVGTNLIGRDSFQEVYIAGITMPITKHNYVVRRVEELADVMRSAFRIAQSGRKGPVLVDIPKDVTSAVCEFNPRPRWTPPAPAAPDATQLVRAAELINGAKRPVIYFGGGVASSEAGEELRQLVQKAQIPATYTLMAAAVLGYGEPLNLGLVGMHGCRTSNKAIDEADVVIAIGTRFSDRVALNPESFAKNAAIVQIDIDPSEINKNVRVFHSVVGDVKSVLRALLPMIESGRHDEWIERIHAWQAQDYRPKDDASALKPHQILGAICEKAGPDAVYVTDVGQHQMWAAQYIRHVRPRSFLTSGGLGTMGFGYGAAIGAQMALGRKRPVIMLTGDGSFHMNLNEACTAVSYDLPIITVIFNNQVLGMVRQWQTAFYGRRYSSTDPHRKTDFVALARAFGADGRRCTNLAEFNEAFDWALQRKGPVWIECVIDKDEKVLPMIPAGGTLDDMMMS
ncbi:MAG TPA: biosynthetic-type acetolactate synthase large subunit [Candidatus Anaerofilum faecale]|nr:biosynthetic-type acetolactate synthase large subunit [Candidatus Anaerofilum faecale]